MWSLLERDGELADIDRCLDRLAGGRGGLLIVEGPAGIGKSVLLDLARDRARSRRIDVLAGRGSELEAGFAFGVVRQLLEPAVYALDGAERNRRLRGAAASARPLFEQLPDVPLSVDGGFALLNGLYWLLVNIAEDRPLAVVVDDLHWGDEASVRWLSFVAARIDTLPILVIVGSRPGRAEVGWMAAHPDATVLQPRPLSPDAVGTWLASQLGPCVEEPFSLACTRATAGNPLLLRELIREIQAERLSPDAAHAATVETLTPRTVTTTVLLRLAGLPPAATDLARAVSVLEEAWLPEAATLAGLDIETADRSAHLLVAADVFATGERLAFSHPVVRAAIYGEMPPGQRARAHGRAAGWLFERAEPADRVAAHVLRSSAPADWGVAVLRRAAADALALGSPSPAAAYLRRAVDEVTDDELRAELLLELGRAESALGAQSAAETLRAAVDATRDDGRRAAATVVLANHQRFAGRGLEAARLLEDARDRLGPRRDRALRNEIDIELLGCSSVSAAARLHLAAWRSEMLREPDGAPVTTWDFLSLANLALDGALAGQPVERVSGLAARASHGSTATGDDRAPLQAMSMAGLAYVLIDHFDKALVIADDVVELTGERGLAGAQAAMLAQRASVHHRVGSLDLAAEDATRALRLGADVHGFDTMLPRAAAVIVLIAAEQATEPPSRFLLDDIDPDSVAFRLLAHSRAELLLARGQHQAALDALLAYGRRNLQLGWPGTATPWRSQAALALHALGHLAEARRLADEEIAIAEHAGAPRAIAIARRSAGLLFEGKDRRRLLAAAVNVIEEGPARLEAAWTIYLYGQELVRHGDPRTGRDLLQRAHATALNCQAHRLVGLIDSVLRAAGTRPRPRLANGHAVLTPAERNVVRLAVARHSNREIAEALFVSEKTIETHLSHVYRKLGVRDRHHLSDRFAELEDTP